MSNFDSALAFVLKVEGGYDFDPVAGEATNQGIRQSTYDIFLARFNTPHRDIKNIQQFEVDAIYYYEYWLPHCDSFQAKSGTVHFNASVNCGPGEATAILQQALGITTSGYFGPVTQAAIRKANDIELAKGYIGKLDQHYQILAAKGANYAEMLRGWLRRNQELKEWIGI